MKAPRIVLTGFFGAGNLGDEAILLSQIRGFSLRRPGSLFTVASFNPEIHRALGLEAIDARDRDALTEAIAEANLLLVGGGGLWQDYWGFKPGDFFSPEPYNIAFYARAPLAAAALGVPFALFANGVGPLANPRARRSVASIASLASAVSVRDSESAELLRAGGLRGEIVVTADPAFNFVPLADAVEPRRRPVRLGVVPRIWSHAPDADDLLSNVARGIESVARELDAEVVFLRFQRPEGTFTEDDQVAIERLCGLLDFDQDAIRIITPSTPEEAAGWLGSCDAVLTMRLHGAILAAVAGLGSVAIAVDPKLEVDAQRLGLESLLLPLRSCSSSNVEQALKRALSNKEPLRATVEAGVDASRRLLDAAFESALACLEKEPLARRPLRMGATATASAPCLLIRLPADAEEARQTARAAMSWRASAVIAAGSEQTLTALRADPSIRDLALIGLPSNSFADFLQAAASVVADIAPASSDPIVIDAVRFDAQKAFDEIVRAEAEHAPAAIIAAPGPMDKDAALTGSVHPDLGASRIRRQLWNEAIAAITGLETASGCGADLARRARRRMEQVIAVPISPRLPDDQARLGWDLARAESFRPSSNLYFIPRPSSPRRDEIEEWIAGRDVVVFPPTVGWTGPLRQRTVHMARALAEAGHAVIYSVERAPADEGPMMERAPGVLTISEPFSTLAFLDDPIVILYSYNVECAPFFRRARTVYEWIDDLSIFAGDPLLIREAHRAALERARVVTATAAALWREAVASRPDAHYLPNAVRVADFDPVTAPESVLPDEDLEWFEADERPVAIYWGAVAPWFDDRLLEKIAALRPDIRIAVLGPGYERELSDLRAKAPENLRYFGARPYESLASYARRSAAAIIPFRLNRITLATSPLKIYEYLAARLPVVSTTLPESALLEGVMLADDVATFSAALDRAFTLRRDARFRAEIGESIKVHDWSQRAAAIRAALGISGAVAPAPIAAGGEMEAGREPGEDARRAQADRSLLRRVTEGLIEREQDLKELDLRREDLERDLQTAGSGSGEVERLAQKLQGRIDEVEEMISERDRRIVWLEKEIAALRRDARQAAETSRQIEELEAEVAGLRAQLAEKEAAVQYRTLQAEEREKIIQARDEAIRWLRAELRTAAEEPRLNDRASSRSDANGGEM